MWFRSSGPKDISYWGRFHAAAEGFTVQHEEGGIWSMHAVVGTGRAVELFLSLLNEFGGAVSVEIEDRHAHQSWKGEGLQADSVRAALAPLHDALIAHAGAELTVFTGDDQVTINQVREVFVYSTSERWASLLEGKGVREARMVRTQSWHGLRERVAPPPELAQAIAATVSALGLKAE
jgi:hypothetical protein